MRWPRTLSYGVAQGQATTKRASEQADILPVGPEYFILAVHKICKNFAICEKRKCVGLGRIGVTKPA